MGVSSKQDCLLRKGIEGIIVVRGCEGVLISLFWGGGICLYFFPFVWVSLSTKGEGVHRSHCAGIVQNHIISRWLKGFKS